MKDTSNHAILTRSIIYKLEKARKTNILKAKNLLKKDLSDLEDFFCKFIEVCNEEKQTLTYKDAKLYTRIVSCIVIAYKYKYQLDNVAPTKQNKVYIFDNFIFDCKSAYGVDKL